MSVHPEQDMAVRTEDASPLPCIIDDRADNTHLRVMEERMHTGSWCWG